MADKEVQSPYQVNFDLTPVLTPAAIIIGSIIISLTAFFSIRNADVSVASDSDVKGTNVSSSAAAAQSSQPSIANQSAGNTKVVGSIDNDPYLGNKDSAKVAIIEFTDYECPYCKRFHDETFDQIVSNYVDSGDAIFVVRDLPLSIHEPGASNKALAAECVNKLAGREKYFEYGAGLYNGTASASALANLASDMGINKGDFESCYDDKEFEEELTADTQAAQQAGIGGTPGFIIGELKDDGSVDGIVVSGAQPYAVFQSAIEQFL